MQDKTIRYPENMFGGGYWLTGKNLIRTKKIPPKADGYG